MNSRIECADAMAFLRFLPDASVDLIVTDPPYYRVKNLAWDRAWKTPVEFIAWLEEIADEWRRVLKANGSLYCFASTEMAARVEIMLAGRFNVLNSIRWNKPTAHHMGARACKEDLRSYFPGSEAVIFCEHANADSMAKGEAGYEAKRDELRGFVFEPIRKYLADEFAALGWNGARLNEICGTASMAGGHFTARSQWSLPTAEYYALLQAEARRTCGATTTNLRRDYDDLRRDYDDLRRDYDDLRRDYDDLRRPFTVTKHVPFTDLWTYRTEPAGAGKHPCEKPYRMAEDIVLASSRPGAVVCDCFCGSGVFLQAAKVHGRVYLGCDADPVWVDTACKRVAGDFKTAQGRLL